MDKQLQEEIQDQLGPQSSQGRNVDNKQFQEEIIRRAKTRSNRQYIAAIVFGGPILTLLAFVYGLHLPPIYFKAWLVLLMLGSLVVFGFTLINCCCPACNKYIGRALRFPFCPRCGAKLR